MLVIFLLTCTQLKIHFTLQSLPKKGRKVWWLFENIYLCYFEQGNFGRSCRFRFLSVRQTLSVVFLGSSIAMFIVVDHLGGIFVAKLWMRNKNDKNGINWQKQLLTIEIVYISNREALFSKEGKFGEELFFWVSAVLLVGKRSGCSFYFWNSMMLHALAKLGPGNTCIEPNPDINFSHELA